MDVGGVSQPGFMDGENPEPVDDELVGDGSPGGEPVDDDPVEFPTMADLVYQARVDAWGSWAADVEAMWVTSTRALDLALRASDEHALAATRG